jgi:hypothetical protein
MTPQDHPGTRGPTDADTRGCDPKACDDDRAIASGGPVREAGGTTGDGNLSPQAASRTGGATSGVGSAQQKPSREGEIPPDA